MNKGKGEVKGLKVSSHRHVYYLNIWTRERDRKRARERGRESKNESQLLREREIER